MATTSRKIQSLENQNQGLPLTSWSPHTHTPILVKMVQALYLFHSSWYHARIPEMHSPMPASGDESLTCFLLPSPSWKLVFRTNMMSSSQWLVDKTPTHSSSFHSHLLQLLAPQAGLSSADGLASSHCGLSSSLHLVLTTHVHT